MSSASSLRTDPGALDLTQVDYQLPDLLGR